LGWQTSLHDAQRRDSCDAEHRTTKGDDIRFFDDASFGPRLFAYLAGWKEVAIPGLNEPWWLTVYIIAPILGAVSGGGIYQRVLRPALQIENAAEPSF